MCIFISKSPCIRGSRVSKKPWHWLWAIQVSVDCLIVSDVVNHAIQQSYIEKQRKNTTSKSPSVVVLWQCPLVGYCARCLWQSWSYPIGWPWDKAKSSLLCLYRVGAPPPTLASRVGAFQTLSFFFFRLQYFPFFFYFFFRKFINWLGA